ncbi:hypothetical protein J8273_0273 [Carpediemonas membranifera]|uniref:Uncharacterized protein n=1 Tax=Carpediemonas membranifera TaxID=201153 RepID=A0A8J6B641_9EUKA|nr:hypothetical protein J8273_0273 [Carpediemonas membranifera]|eukprot:KAG9395059.1 hypothetical protein J8273_0273 [Carpediemonas membranifera]
MSQAADVVSACMCTTIIENYIIGANEGELMVLNVSLDIGIEKFAMKFPCQLYSILARSCDDIFAFGIAWEESTHFVELFKADLAQPHPKWTPLPRPPVRERLTYFAVDIEGSNLIIHGGDTPDEPVLTDRFGMDLDTLEWVRLPSEVARHGHILAGGLAIGGFSPTQGWTGAVTRVGVARRRSNARRAMTGDAGTSDGPLAPCPVVLKAHETMHARTAGGLVALTGARLLQYSVRRDEWTELPLQPATSSAPSTPVSPRGRRASVQASVSVRARPVLGLVRGLPVIFMGAERYVVLGEGLIKFRTLITPDDPRETVRANDALFVGFSSDQQADLLRRLRLFVANSTFDAFTTTLARCDVTDDVKAVATEAGALHLVSSTWTLPADLRFLSLDDHGLDPTQLALMLSRAARLPSLERLVVDSPWRVAPPADMKAPSWFDYRGYFGLADGVLSVEVADGVDGLVKLAVENGVRRVVFEKTVDCDAVSMGALEALAAGGVAVDTSDSILAVKHHTAVMMRQMTKVDALQSQVAALQDAVAAAVDRIDGLEQADDEHDEAIDKLQSMMSSISTVLAYGRAK